MERTNHSQNRKLILAICIGLVAALCAFALAGCGSNSSSNSSSSTSGTSSSSSDDTTITVGASPTPHAEILNNISDTLANEGYTLNVVEYSDYVTPDEALANGEIDANFYQHTPYLENYNQENGTDLVSVGSVHFEPLAVYAGSSNDLENVPDGAKIAVPSDPTNEARALNLLEANGVITLRQGAGLEATANDITDNPHNIQLVEAEAAALPRQLEDCNFAVINRNYAISANLSNDLIVATEDANSDAASRYANIVAVRNGDQDSPKIQALIQALQSDQTRDFINSNYNGAVIPIFNGPETD